MSDASEAAGRGWRLSEWFVFRRPTLPFAALSGPGDVNAAREALRKWSQESAVQDALFLASPAFLASLEVWRQTPDSEAGRKIERALTRYRCRMASRSTGFGLFAAVGLGTVDRNRDASTRFSVSAPGALRRHTRVATEVVYTFAQNVAQSAETRDAVTYRLNPTASRRGRELHLYASEFTPTTSEHQHVVLELAPWLEAVLRRTEKPAATRAALVTALRRSVRGTKREDAEAILDQLIDTQALVGELHPPLTGEDPLAAFAALLPDGVPGRTLAANVRASLRALDAAGLGARAEGYAQAVAPLDAGTGTVPVSADLFDPATPVLEATLVRELNEAAFLFHRLEPERDVAWRNLLQAFERRFDREPVRLLDLFDPKLGLEGLRDPPVHPDSLDVPLALDLLGGAGVGFARGGPVHPMDALLARHLGHALSARRDEIELTREELGSVIPRAAASPLTQVQTLTCRVFRSEASPQTVALLRGVVSRSVSAIVGRAAHLDRGLAETFRSLLETETALQPEVLPVEIIYQGHPSRAHITGRVSLGLHELVLHGRSGVSAARQLTLDDLWIQFDDGRFRLFSKSLQREVRVVMNNADLPRERQELGVYHFLVRLSLAAGRASRFSWGPLDTFTVLPRVKMGRVILSPARWNFDATHLRELTGKLEEDAAVLRKLRDAFSLPRFVQVSDGENDLSFDLDNPLCVDALAHEARAQKKLTLTEVFPGSEFSWAASSDGGERFANDVFLPLVPSARASLGNARGPRAGRLEAKVLHRPGSSWWYARIFLAPDAEDAFLVEHWAPRVRKLAREGQLGRWFFLRYGDPEEHLRLRLEAKNPRMRAKLLDALTGEVERAAKSGLVERFELGTYAPETERYGGPAGVALAETWFTHDSEAVLRVLSALGPEAHALRFLAAFAGLAGLLDVAGLDSSTRMEFLRARAEALRGPTPRAGLNEKLGALFRHHRSALESILRRTPPQPDLNAAWDSLQARDQALRPLAKKLRGLAAQGTLTCSVEAWVASQIHMHVNRLLTTHQPEQELALYELAAKAYRSLEAR